MLDPRFIVYLRYIARVCCQMAVSMLVLSADAQMYMHENNPR